LFGGEAGRGVMCKLEVRGKLKNMKKETPEVLYFWKGKKKSIERKAPTLNQEKTSRALACSK